jgi:tetratricopeptide (TPR) repeat protein
MNRKQRRAAHKTAAAHTTATGPAPAASPDFIQPMFAEALRRHQAGELAEAERLYRQVLALRPRAYQAHYSLGLALQVQGRLEEAVASYQQVIAINPRDSAAHANLGAALKELGRLDEAMAVLSRGIAVAPHDPMLHTNMGAVLIRMGKTDEAIAPLRRSLALRPDDAGTWSNLGAALQEENCFGEAIEACRKAIALQPDYVQAHYNLGMSLSRDGHPAEGLAAFRRAVAFDPNLAEAHFGLAQALLQQGAFEEGWAEYEWRWRLPEHSWIRDIRGIAEKPRWSGEDLAGKTILIHAEQGLGDTLQFVRYVPRVVARAGHVVLMVQGPLKHLLRTIEGVTLVGLDEAPPAFDFHCPLLSVPRMFGTNAATIPGDVPYLSAEPEACARWRARLGNEGIRIGIAWQGKPGVNIDKGRSIPLAAFAPLARVPGVRLISLQKNVGLEQLGNLPAGMRVETLGAEFDNGPAAFRDTSAVMMNLDLVVTSDTSVAHIAGALARPTWLALKASPEWRWGLATASSPWYPTMRLFRQATAGDWTSVFARMAGELAQFPAMQKVA